MKSPHQSLESAKSFLTRMQTVPVYAVIGKSSPWAVDSVPPETFYSTHNEFLDFNESVFAKLILPQDSSLVVPRIDWATGVVHEQWSSFEETSSYCLTDDMHVYRCLSNAGGVPTTVKPTGVSTGRFETADGYVWKYMYSITEYDDIFLTDNLMPVRVLAASETGYENQYAAQVSVVAGTVDRIDIINGGLGYSGDTTATITGDGTGATATLVIHGITGEITGVVVANLGSGYTYASVTFSDPAAQPGTGATALCVLSPKEGHGHSAALELSARDVVVSASIAAGESGLILGDLDVRKVLLIESVLDQSDALANDPAYNNTATIAIEAVSGSFVVGEKVETAAGSANVVFIDGTTLYVNELYGDLSSGSITGATSAASATITTYTDRPLTQSGTVIFREYFLKMTKALADSLSFMFWFRF